MRRKKPMKPAEIARLGGHARAKSMSPRARSLAARAAVAVRWQRWRETVGPIALATDPRGHDDNPTRVD